MQTQDQKRAKHAYEKVSAMVNAEGEDKFKTLASKLPAMVLQCGALPTLAYYEKQKSRQAFNAINDWLLNHAGLPWTVTQGNSRERLIHHNTKLQLYRLVAREAVAYGTWLKRATETLLENPERLSPLIKSDQ